MATATADADDTVAAAMETCGHAASLGTREYLFQFPGFEVTIDCCPPANLIGALNTLEQRGRTAEVRRVSLSV